MTGDATARIAGENIRDAIIEIKIEDCALGGVWNGCRGCGKSRADQLVVVALVMILPKLSSRTKVELSPGSILNKRGKIKKRGRTIQ